MKHNPYPPELTQAVRQYIEETKKNFPQNRLIAAFDADGTLWPVDISENFFHYQIKNNLIQNLPQHPWDFYLDLKEHNPISAYYWLAQICQGALLDQVRQWADEAIKQDPAFTVFKPQAELIKMLISYDVEVFIVTASVKWAVEAAASYLKINHSNVLGIETLITNDQKITIHPKTPPTYKSGKLNALLTHTESIKPFLCCGNTLGDYELLEGATQFKIAVQSAPPSDPLYQAEQSLFAIASEKKWITHIF